MSRLAFVGLVWLVLSVAIAPIIGRMIHDPMDCPECRANAAERARKRAQR